MVKAWIKAKYVDRRWHGDSPRQETTVTEEKEKPVRRSKKAVRERELKEIIPNAPKIVVREKEEEPNLLDFDDLLTSDNPPSTEQQT